MFDNAVLREAFKPTFPEINNTAFESTTIYLYIEFEFGTTLISMQEVQKNALFKMYQKVHCTKRSV